MREENILLFAVLLFHACIAASNCRNASVSVEGCATKWEALESSLYKTGNNFVELHRSFFPPGTRPTRFIRITFIFLDENGVDNGCNASYIWSLGEILFFQPPSVYKFSALFFNYPNNNLTDMVLELPNECRPLIGADEYTSECSCVQTSKRFMFLMTLLSTYAKFFSQDLVVIESGSGAAVCTEKLEESFYNSEANRFFYFIIFCFSVVIPIATTAVLFSQIRKEDTASYITDPKKHGTVVAYVLTGTVVSLLILTANILASVTVITNKHEYSEYIGRGKFNLWVSYIHAGWAIATNSIILFCFFYILACFNLKQMINNKCCGKKCHHRLVTSLAILVVGQDTYRKISKRAENPTISVLFLIMLCLPLICLSPHLGYILIAWLTESGKFNTSLIIFYIILVILVIVFQRSYNNNSNVRFSLGWCRKRYGDSNITPQEEKDFELGSAESDDEDETENTQAEKDGTCGENGCISHDKSVSGDINTHSFCLLAFYGVFFWFIAGMFVAAIVVLPFPAEDFLTYLMSTVELAVVFAASKYIYSGFNGKKEEDGEKSDNKEEKEGAEKGDKEFKND